MDQFVNLTPHALNVHVGEGSIVTIEPSGEVARVTSESVPAGWAGGVIPAFRTKLGEVVGLPEPDGSVFIVSGMVAAAAPRDDVVSPGDLLRDGAGRPVGCHGLRRSI